MGVASRLLDDRPRLAMHHGANPSLRSASLVAALASPEPSALGRVAHHSQDKLMLRLHLRLHPHLHLHLHPLVCAARYGGCVTISWSKAAANLAHLCIHPYTRKARIRVPPNSCTPEQSMHG